MPGTSIAGRPRELVWSWLLRDAPEDVDLVSAAEDSLAPATAVARSRARLHRRRVVVAVTMVVGAALLGWSLTREPGDPWFVVATVLLALTWAAGARLSGHVSLGWWQTPAGRHRRPVLPGLVIGLGAVLLFCAGGLLVSLVEPLRTAVLQVLDHAQWSTLPLVAGVALLNGVAEEMFFRGALFHAVESVDARRRWRPVLLTTLLYAAVTGASGNVMLVFAAAVLGLLTGLHRRATGGVLGAILIHVVWSSGMVLLLRPVLELLG